MKKTMTVRMVSFRVSSVDFLVLSFECAFDTRHSKIDIGHSIIQYSALHQC